MKQTVLRQINCKKAAGMNQTINSGAQQIPFYLQNKLIFHSSCHPTGLIRKLNLSPSWSSPTLLLPSQNCATVLASHTVSRCLVVGMRRCDSSSLVHQEPLLRDDYHPVHFALWV